MRIDDWIKRKRHWEDDRLDPKTGLWLAPWRFRLARPISGAQGIKCIAFLASAALVGAMVAAGKPVRSHPLRSWQYVVPEKYLSNSEIWELLQKRDFVFISTVVFLTTPLTTNNTYTSDATWNNSNNSVELVAGGGSGASLQRIGTSGFCSGGGGGEYGATTNFSFATPGTTTATWQTGAGGAGLSPTVGSSVATTGNNGGDTWWDGTTQAGATLGAIHGGAGQQATSTSPAGTGGTAGTGGVGTTHHAGGRGGNVATGVTSGATGGGGAGGTTAVGGNGVDLASGSGPSDGGDGGATGGGTHGAKSTTLGTPGGAGGTGTAWTQTSPSVTSGPGGGGGGFSASNNSAQSTAAGGNYGGGSGACFNGGSGGGGSTRASTGKGGDGIVVLTWTPPAAVKQSIVELLQATKRASFW